MAIERGDSDSIEHNLLGEKTQSEKEESLRRWRRVARVVGLVNVGVGVVLEYFVLRVLEIETNTSALQESIYAAGSIIPGFFIADGASDVIKGGHHYLGMTIWKAVARNPEKKAMLQRQIDTMVGKRNSS